MANQKIFDIKINGIKEGIDGASTLRSKLDNASQGVTDYSKAMREATKEVKNIQGQMVGLDKSSKQWKDLAKQAGEYKDRIDDIRQATARYASDTKALDDVINLAKSTTSAFGILQGVMNEFGVESEGAAEAIKKLQATMTILTSLQQLQNSLKGSSATATLLTKAMGALSLGMNGATTATKAFRIALMGIGIGIVIGLITTLYENWDKLASKIGLATEAQKKANKMFEVGAKAYAKASAELQVYTNRVNDFIGTKEQEKALVDELNQKYGESFGHYKTLAEWKDALKKKTEDYIQSMVLEAQMQEKINQLTQALEKQQNAKKRYHEEITWTERLMGETRKTRQKEFNEANREVADLRVSIEELGTKITELNNKGGVLPSTVVTKTTKAIKSTVDDAKKKVDEAVEYKAKADEAYYRSYVEYLIKQKEELIKYYEAEVKMYSAGPPEKYQAALKKVNTATEELVTLQRQLHLYDFFNDYKDNIDASATSLDDFMVGLNTLVEKFKASGKAISVDEFGKIAKSLPQFSKLTEDQLKYLYHIYIDYLKDGLTKAKKTEEDILSVQEEQLKKEMEGIEKNTLKFELESDKKSETAQALVQTLNAQWDNYLEHVKKVYGEDSKQYLEAQKKKQQQNPSSQTPSKKSSGTISGNQFMDLEDNGGVNWGAIRKGVEDAYDAYVSPVVNGLSDTIGMMMDIAIEEAEEALEEIEELYDSAQEKTDKSRERLSELETAMSTANGGRLEQLKQEQAEEIQLMLEREAEEKRLEKEKEKREKELEKKKKQQRKLELRVQMVEALASGALAAINGFATKPFIPVGLAMGALATTLTAVQLGIMAKQMSKLADGGMLQGASHAQGGIPIGNTGIEVEGGEYVVNKRSTAKYLPLLQALNEEGARHKTRANQIGKYADGGQLNYQRIDDNFNQLNQGVQLRSALESINFTPVVEVVEVAKGLNNLSSVRESAGGSSLLK